MSRTHRPSENSRRRHGRKLAPTALSDESGLLQDTGSPGAHPGSGIVSERDHAVSEMLPEVGIEPANLSQQLSILRRAGLVTARREGLSVTYALTSPKVADLLAIARGILTGVVAGQAELLEDLPESAALASDSAS